MADLRAAVIGGGKLGARHARQHAPLDGVRLVAVVDTDPARARQIAHESNCTALADYRELDGAVDLVSVASPSLTHYEIALAMLRQGVDVLLEKPMAASLAEARELAARAAENRRILQIGHLERFNPAILRMRSMLRAPRFIECHRLAPFTERGIDVDVILDLMTHDLDVILSCTEAEPVSVEAIGVAVLTETIDVANARLRFADGMIA